MPLVLGIFALLECLSILILTLLEAPKMLFAACGVKTMFSLCNPWQLAFSPGGACLRSSAQAGSLANSIRHQVPPASSQAPPVLHMGRSM